MITHKNGSTRLSIVLPGLGSGGAERVATQLAARLAGQGVAVSVVTLAGTSDDFYRLPDNVRRVALGLQSASDGFVSALIANFRRVTALRRAIRNEASDVVLALTSRTAVLTVLATIGRRPRLVLSERVHPPAVPLGRTWEWLRRITYARANLVLAQTERAAYWLRKHTRAREVAVIPNPLWTNPVQSEPSVPPATCVAHERKLLLAVGRLTYQKGFDLLIDAFRELRAEHPAWRLAILGEGEMRAELERAARGLDVAFPGAVGNTQEWYRRADLFVLSSRFEGFPNVLLEAMGSGTAVVGFDCPAGASEIVDSGDNGVLVPVGDVAALIGALGGLMGDDRRRAELAACARDSVQRFHEDVVMEQWRHALGIRLPAVERSE